MKLGLDFWGLEDIPTRSNGMNLQGFFWVSLGSCRDLRRERMGGGENEGGRGKIIWKWRGINRKKGGMDEDKRGK